MTNLNVTYADLEQAQTQILHGKEELTQKLNELKQVVDNLTASGFQTDQASVQFDSTFEEFTTNTTKAVSALEGLGNFLGAAKEALANTDAELAKAIQS